MFGLGDIPLLKYLELILINNGNYFSKFYFINSLDESNGYEAEKGQQSNHNQHEHHENLNHKDIVNFNIIKVFNFD